MARASLFRAAAVARALLSGALLGGALLLGGAASAAPRVGAPAPAFVGTDLEGRPLDLAALRGRVVVVNLWAIWCTPCRAEMPMLDAFQQRRAADGVVLAGLSADRHRDIADVRRAMQAVHYPAALLADAQVNGFGAPSALPQTIVIDRAGVVRAVFDGGQGPLTATALDRAVDGLIPPKG